MDQLSSPLQLCYSKNAKIRWLYNFLKVSRLLRVDDLREKINERVTKLAKRKGQDLDEKTMMVIVENLLLAGINKRLVDFRIKPWSAKVKPHSPTVQYLNDGEDQGYTYKMSACPIFKEKNYRLRNHPSILIPGFVPDGNEAFFLLRKCFLRFGSVYYVNYPAMRFDREVLFHQLYDMIAHINHRKFKNAGKRGAPFLVGTSFGCGVILSFLKWLKEKGLDEELTIQGVVLISPVLSLEDVVDSGAKRQRTLVGRAIANLMEVDENDPEAIAKAMLKSRSIFLKMFTSGRDQLNLASKDLIPVFAIEEHVLSVFNYESGGEKGFFQRYLELARVKPLATEFLTSLPTLVLFAEGEKDVLSPNSPTLSHLSDIETLRTIFPNGSVEFVYSKDEGRKVTHSDLIFQANRFAEHLQPWLERNAT